ncbi:hypothetical protein RB195_002437 [Necator americanus]|uniref:Uncharacterized protein n=1 Tax=Necator americanus TaxID=51031 RepID=A0ABR1DLX3_NECAM
MHKGLLLLLLVLDYALGEIILPLSLFNKDWQGDPKIDFGTKPYIYVASNDSDELLKKITCFLEDSGGETKKTALVLATWTKAYSTAINQKRAWTGDGDNATFSVKSTLTKEEAASLKGVLYTTNAADDTTPVFDAWKITAEGARFNFKKVTTAVFLNNAPTTRAQLSNFSADPDVELGIFSGVPNGTTYSAIITYNGSANTTMDPAFLALRAFTVRTTGSASFTLGGNISRGPNEMKTHPSMGILLSAEYPKKTGAAEKQLITYDKKMNFTVKASFDLNDGEYITVTFMNLKAGSQIYANNLTSSGSWNMSVISEQLSVQPSSKYAGAFLVSYATQDTDQQHEPTGSSTQTNVTTTSGPNEVTTTNGCTSVALSLLSLFVVTVAAAVLR